MNDPTHESFWASKTMILLAMSMGAIIVLVAAGIVVKVFFKVDVFEIVATGIAGVTGQSAQGTWRNVRTDTPIRQQYQAAQLQQQPQDSYDPTPKAN